jgi:predicted nucleotidyltransferase
MSRHPQTTSAGRAPHRAERQTTLEVTTPLVLLGTAPSMQRLLLYFVIRPGARPHLRLLQRELGIGSASIQRDLARMTAASALRQIRNRSQRFVRYAVVPHPFWEVARALVATSYDTADLLREALRDVSGLDAAFLFGSASAGTAAPDSDLDVFIIGDRVDTRALYANLFEVGQALNRQVNTVRYTRTALAERLADGAEFPRNVLEEPKRWLAGNPEAILPIASAAGVRLLAGSAWP